MIRHIRKQLGPGYAIIGVGGIDSPEAAKLSCAATPAAILNANIVGSSTFHSVIPRNPPLSPKFRHDSRIYVASLLGLHIVILLLQHTIYGEGCKKGA